MIQRIKIAHQIECLIWSHFLGQPDRVGSRASDFQLSEMVEGPTALKALVLEINAARKETSIFHPLTGEPMGELSAATLRFVSWDWLYYALRTTEKRPQIEHSIPWGEVASRFALPSVIGTLEGHRSV